LDRGAHYLIEKRLFRRTSDQQTIDDSWLNLCFPRFYHYDILRGLSFLLKWCRLLKRNLPIGAIKESIEHIDSQFPDDRVRVQLPAWEGATARYKDATAASWTKMAAASYPLLEAVSQLGSESPYLTASWTQTRQHLKEAIEEGLIA